jgi:hypothetical protein
MPELKFIEKDHSYWIEEDRVPGLSEVLQKVGLVKSYRGIDPFYANRGIAVHRANELWLKGDLDEASLDPVCEPFFRAFKGHITETGFSPVLIEMPFYSEKEGYACRIDYLRAGEGLERPERREVYQGA